MPDSDRYAHLLTVTFPLREPVLRQAIASLGLPCGSQGLDAGCGIGLCLPLLAEAVGEGGHIAGADLNAGLLRHARRRIGEARLGDRVSLEEEGSMSPKKLKLYR